MSKGRIYTYYIYLSEIISYNNKKDISMKKHQYM